MLVHTLWRLKWREWTNRTFRGASKVLGRYFPSRDCLATIQNLSWVLGDITAGHRIGRRMVQVHLYNVQPSLKYGGIMCVRQWLGSLPEKNK